MPNNDSSRTDEISISRAKLDSITVYDVTEDELEIIERGSPSSNFLLFAVALLSIFVSFLITLLTMDIKSDRTFTFFTVVAVITFIAGIFLLFLWWRSNRSSKTIFVKIRNRKNVSAVTQAIAEEEAGSETNEQETT